MHHWYDLSTFFPFSPARELTQTSVFSAPKYCDSTENRGAFINIGPDYKLQYEQFDAVPHPDIRPMVRPSALSKLTPLQCTNFFDRHMLKILSCPL